MGKKQAAPAGAGAPQRGEAPPSAAQWSHLLRHLPAPVYLCNADGYLTDCNQAAIDLWGRAPEVGRDRWCGSLRMYQADGQSLPLDQSPMAHTLRTRQAVRDAEIIIERPDGSRRNVRTNPSPVFDEAGNLTGAVNQLLDATAFREADHARARLAAIIESSEDAIISKSLESIIQSWNQGAERLFGYTADEVIGRPITIIIPDDRLEEEPQVLGRIRRGEVVDHFETIRRRKDGSPIEISLTISPIRNADGRVIGTSKIARDIGDRRRYEQELLLADRKKDEFIATMAHELRNPLAPLTASLHLIQMSGYSGHVPRNTLEMMQRQVGHLTRLVEDLLDLSRLSHGTIELKKEVLTLDDIVNDAIEIVGPGIEAKGHHLELALPQNLQLIGDRTRLVQVLANLLNNASKFTPKSGLVKLTAGRDADQVRICVKDNGIGIAREHQERVFGMFTRVQNGSGADGGMGIGLALARHLVALHNGSISLHSDGPGQGTEFIVVLPLDVAVGAPAISQHSAPLQAAAAARRILVVDDNEDAAASLSALFSALGHQVATAHSGQEALAAGPAFLPDVVLLDIGLPDISGNEVASRMRLEPWGKTATLVALTGWGQADDRKRSAAAGFDHHFVKPVDLDVLERLLAAQPAPPSNS